MAAFQLNSVSCVFCKTTVGVLDSIQYVTELMEDYNRFQVGELKDSDAICSPASLANSNYSTFLAAKTSACSFPTGSWMGYLVNCDRCGYPIDCHCCKTRAKGKCFNHVTEMQWVTQINSAYVGENSIDTMSRARQYDCRHQSHNRSNYADTQAVRSEETHKRW